METKRHIPETGAVIETVRFHPIDWSFAADAISRIRSSCLLHTLIISDNFSIDLKFIIDAFITYTVNYMLTIHSNHYNRLNVMPAGYSPSKGKILYNEPVPEFFVTFARHISRPRILPDGSLSLPQPSLHYCDAARYGGLAALTDADIARNGVAIGVPNAALNAVLVDGVRLAYRPNLFLALRRSFDALPFVTLMKVEGLVPARLSYWSNIQSRFVRFLDLDNIFEKSVFDLDTVIGPIAFPAMDAPPALPAAAAADPAANVAFRAHYEAQFVPAIQWLGHNVLIDSKYPVSRSQFIAVENTGMNSETSYSRAYCRDKLASQFGTLVNSSMFPPLGLVDEVKDLRTLVNDLGSWKAPPTLKHKTDQQASSVASSDVSDRHPVGGPEPLSDKKDPPPEEKKKAPRKARARGKGK